MDSEHTAWRKGYNAAGRGLGLCDNPYHRSTRQRQAWRDGWFDNEAPDTAEGKPLIEVR
jgi:hypothetical protein